MGLAQDATNLSWKSFLLNVALRVENKVSGDLKPLNLGLQPGLHVALLGTLRQVPGFQTSEFNSDSMSFSVKALIAQFSGYSYFTRTG